MIIEDPNNITPNPKMKSATAIHMVIAPNDEEKNPITIEASTATPPTVITPAFPSLSINPSAVWSAIFIYPYYNKRMGSTHTKGA